ncbi:hypothetical protein [Gemella sanguinis]
MDARTGKVLKVEIDN